MISIDYSEDRGYSFRQGNSIKGYFEEDYLTKREVLGYINLLNPNYSHIIVHQGK